MKERNGEERRRELGKKEVKKNGTRTWRGPAVLVYARILDLNGVKGKHGGMARRVKR